MKHIMGPQSRSTLTNVKEGDVQPNAGALRRGKVFKALTKYSPMLEVITTYQRGIMK
jgi:hypothetical protein